MSRRHLLMLLALSGLWGASFLFIKIGVRELAPQTLVCVRMLLGALTVLPFALAAGGSRRLVRELRESWTPLLVVGLLSSAIPITMLSWAEQRIDSGLAAVIQAAAPLFTAVIALRFNREDRVTGLRLVGFLVGFGGVALLVGVQPRGDLLAALAVVGTGLCYAIAAVVAGRSFASVSSLAVSLWTLTIAFVVLLPFAVVQLPSGFTSTEVTLAMLALGIGGTGIAYVLYYGIIGGAGASYGILVTYLVPALALLYGALFLGEHITVSAVAGLLLVLGGVALGTRAWRLTRRRRAEERLASAP